MKKVSIKEVHVWADVRIKKGDYGESRMVAQVHYSNGNVKRWYSDNQQEWPKTVLDYIENHERYEENSQCDCYK